MTTLGELAKIIRSKNAGPFELTFDVLFEDEQSYRRVLRSGVLTKERFGRLYGVPESRILLIHHDAARAVKISMPRPVPQGDLDDGDCYGGQQYGPLVELPIPEES